MRDLPLIAEWQRVTHRLLADLDRELADLGLSAGETNALACFVRQRQRSVRELVLATGQRPSTLTGVLDRLERKRLVERVAHPEDRRSLVVRLTADGARTADRVSSAFAAVERQLPAEEMRRALAAFDAQRSG